MSSRKFRALAIAAVAAAGLLVASAVVALQASAGPIRPILHRPPEPTDRLISKGLPGLCAHAYTTRPGDMVRFERCLPQVSPQNTRLNAVQRFRVERIGANELRIRNASLNQCLEAAPLIIMTTCQAGNERQRWFALGDMIIISPWAYFPANPAIRAADQWYLGVTSINDFVLTRGPDAKAHYYF